MHIITIIRLLSLLFDCRSPLYLLRSEIFKAASENRSRKRNVAVSVAPEPVTLPVSELSVSPTRLDTHDPGHSDLDEGFGPSTSTVVPLQDHSQPYGIAIGSLDQTLNTGDVLDFSAWSTPTLAFQHVHSLEPPSPLSTVQLCGTSSEMDPWLLRHCKYDEQGIRSLYRLQIRNVGGVPVEGVVPVHFSVIDESLHDMTNPDSLTTLSQELKSIVEPSLGRNLISLFLKFISPSIPVISRSQTTVILTNSNGHINEIPTCLLAAIYASAIPFSSHDPCLYLSSVYEDSAVERLWDIVYELISANIRTPRLATLQAALLYMQRPCKRNSRALSDHPSVWQFWGSVVGLASSLGLHLECRRWAIPSWEKRLRRRLWWSVYLEDTWRSLLLGRPPFIQTNEWDVGELDEVDFGFRSPSHMQSPYGLGENNCQPGCFMVRLIRLTKITSDIQRTFYTLKASQMLCSDFQASVSAAKPLRERLHAWYTDLPDKLRLNQQGSQWNTCPNDACKSGATLLHILYLTLELLLYRAILRPLARSTLTPIVPDEEFSTGFPCVWDDINQQSYNLDGLCGVDLEEFGDATEGAINAAENCAGVIITIVRCLGSNDLDMMCYNSQMATFSGKKILITGAAGGIGRATAVELAKLGACVGLSDINEKDLLNALAECESVSASPKQQHMYYTLDVGDFDNCNRFVVAFVDKILPNIMDMSRNFTPLKQVFG
ncbi:Transcription factor [Fusarium albosuccineum]|uniref:Transcription factor n=1 Tax=Fusarium albosuccineum TaxID=1237068 RepID=A0A8H4KXJ5_9HYPO|nr:Transcription factor [Fusarium albosuccineum]